MNFLAVNTAGESVEVALVTGGKEYVAFDPEYKKASEVLLPLIDKVFKDAGADIADVDFFACCAGPGSFTGIRIGLSTVRAFCQSLNKPCVAVTSSLVLSYNETRSCGTVLTVSDAGNGFSYVAAYDDERNVLTEPKCVESSGVAQFLGSYEKPYAVCCDSLSASLVQDGVVHKTGGKALVKAVECEYKRTGARDYKVIEPLYVRKSQAEQQFGGSADAR